MSQNKNKIRENPFDLCNLCSIQRRAVVKALLSQRGDMLVIAGLGAPAWDVTAAGDEPLNFPLWGAREQGSRGEGKVHPRTPAPLHTQAPAQSGHRRLRQ